MKNNNNLTCKLTENLNIIYKKLEELENNLRRIDTLLANTIEALQIPKTLSDRLTELDTLLFVTDKVLLGLSNVPYVCVVAKVVKTAVQSIKQIVHPIKTNVSKIEKQIRPLRNKLIKIRSYLAKVLPVVTFLKEFALEEHKLILSMNEALIPLKEGRYKKDQQEKLETLSKQLNQILQWPMFFVVHFIDKLNSIAGSLNVLLNICGILKKIIKPIEDSINQFGELGKVLGKLNKLLDKKISLGFFSASINDILEGVSKIPGLSQMMKIAQRILKKPLKQLQNMIPSVPSLGGLTDNFKNMLNKLNSITDITARLTPDINNLIGDKNFKNKFNDVVKY
ncbi:MAG: hypothetical protein ACEPO8_14920 [Rhodothermaceae bacterium]